MLCKCYDKKLFRVIYHFPKKPKICIFCTLDNGPHSTCVIDKEQKLGITAQLKRNSNCKDS